MFSHYGYEFLFRHSENVLCVGKCKLGCYFMFTLRTVLPTLRM